VKRARQALDEIVRCQDKNEKAKGDWKYASNSLILKTQVIFTTLSTAGIEKLEICKDSIDYLIIDEAC
jgi:superfamily I DNA and/or RNA helicase